MDSEVKVEWRMQAGAGEVWIGDYQLNGNLFPGQIVITHRSGEGGAYDERQLEAAIRSFVAEHF